MTGIGSAGNNPVAKWAELKHLDPKLLSEGDIQQAATDLNLTPAQVRSLRDRAVADAAAAADVGRVASGRIGGGLTTPVTAGSRDSSRSPAMVVLMGGRQAPRGVVNVFEKSAVPGSRQERLTRESLGLDQDLDLTADQKASWKAAFDALPAAGGVTRNQELPENVQAWNATWWAMHQAIDPDPSMAPKAGEPRTYDFTNFIVQPDIVGMSRLGAMFKMARSGTKVRAMFDATGTKAMDVSGIGQDYLQEIVNTGNATIRSYNPKTKNIPRQLAALIKDTTDMDAVACNHKKYEIINGQIAKGGGRNTAVYYYTPGDHTYNDHETLTLGRDAAAAMKKSFEEDFNDPRVTYEIKKEWDIGPQIRRDVELAGAYFLMDSWLQGDPPLTASEKAALKSDPQAREALVDKMLERMTERLKSEKFGDKPIGRGPGWWDKHMPNILSPLKMGIESLRNQALQLAELTELHDSSGSYTPPNDQNSFAGETKVIGHSSCVGTTKRGIDPVTGQEQDPLVDTLVKLCETAQKRIVIANPYVVLTKGAHAALKAAAERGVQIDVLTNSPESTDSLLTQAFFVKAWPKALATIPNMRLLVTTKGRNADGTDDEDGMKRKLHGKWAVFDDQVIADGSFNMDVISSKVNSEGVQVVRSEELAKQYTQSYGDQIEDLNNGVVEYTIERDADGKPVLDSEGEPIVEFGPRNHMSQDELDDFNKLASKLVYISKLDHVQDFFWRPEDVDLRQV